MRRQKQRLWMIGAAAVVLAVATSLALVGFRDAIVFFYSPTQIVSEPPEEGQRIRVGGLVEAGSVARPAEGGAAFTLTDGAATVRVIFDGALPDLFREGQGIVAEGALGPDGVFIASNVLAKHDEQYMPPEVANALRESGMWNDGSGS